MISTRQCRPRWATSKSTTMGDPARGPRRQRSEPRYRHGKWPRCDDGARRLGGIRRAGQAYRPHEEQCDGKFRGALRAEWTFLWLRARRALAACARWRRRRSTRRARFATNRASVRRTGDVKASRAVYDEIHHRIFYRTQVVELEGIPVFYTPIFEIRTATVKTASGVLVPDWARRALWDIRQGSILCCIQRFTGRRPLSPS